jgi:Flp pilus assembly protein TadG
MNSSRRLSKPLTKLRHGQSLVEFALLAPLLITLLLATWTIGVGMHVGSRATSAVQEPATRKLQLAAIPGDSSSLAQSLIQNFNQQGIALSNPSVDSTRLVGQTNVTAVFIGEKPYTANLPGVSLPFNFSATQLLPSALLLANNSAGRASTATQAYPGIGNQAFASMLGPADFGFNTADLPIKLPLISPTCVATAPVSIDEFNTLLGLTVTPPTVPSPTPTPTPTPSPAPTPAPTPSPTPAPAPTPSPTEGFAFFPVFADTTAPYTKDYVAQSSFPAAVLKDFTERSNSMCAGDVVLDVPAAPPPPGPSPVPPSAPTPGPAPSPSSSLTVVSMDNMVRACKYQLASRMLTRWIQRVQAAGGCSTSPSGNAADVQFPTNNPSY